MSLEDSIKELNASVKQLISALEGASSLAMSDTVTAPTKMEDEKPAVTGETNLETVKQAFMKLVNMTGKGRPAMEKILAKFKASNLSGLPADQYPAVLEAINEELQA